MTLKVTNEGELELGILPQLLARKLSRLTVQPQSLGLAEQLGIPFMAIGLKPLLRISACGLKGLPRREYYQTATYFKSPPSLA